MSTKKYSDINLYDLLGIQIEADQAEIRKAYRKKALECHPDKNPDNPKAVERFHELSYALEVLADVSARAAYDKVLKAKKAAELRNKQLDSKRQKLKADLERREQNAFNNSRAGQGFYNTIPKTDEEILQEQLIRLRREGSKLLEEEQRLMRDQMSRAMTAAQNAATATPAFDSTQHRIKLKWKSEKHDPANGGYTEEKLLNFLKKYGDIVAFVMSKKCGAALVEFKNFEASQMALAYEKGMMENPLVLEWVRPPPSATHREPSSTASSLDFEDLVLRKMRQAEERKRLIEKLQKEDLEEI